jgi:hypothetical protein
LLKPISCVEVTGVGLVVRLRDEWRGLFRQLNPVGVIEKLQTLKLAKTGSIVGVLQRNILIV